MSKKLERFAAKLLFQFRVVINNISSKRRICEERIILLKEKAAGDALKKARKRGKKSQYNYINDDGNKVYFEFIGIMDLMSLGVEIADDEVWYEIKDYLSPMERKNKFIPPISQLCAIQNEKEENRNAKRNK